MELDLDSGRLVIFLGGLTLFALVETMLPARRWQESRFKRFFFHASVAAFNTVLVRILIYVPFLLWIVYVEQQGWGISRWLGLDGWVEVVVSLVMIDLFDYFWHRANHQVPFLWRFHKAHHADNEMDVTTALRFHPGELFLSAFAKASWVLVWGPSAIAWFVFEGMISLCAQFHHSNIDLPDPVERALSRIIVTPRFIPLITWWSGLMVMQTFRRSSASGTPCFAATTKPPRVRKALRRRMGSACPRHGT